MADDALRQLLTDATMYARIAQAERSTVTAYLANQTSPRERLAGLPGDGDGSESLGCEGLHLIMNPCRLLDPGGGKLHDHLGGSLHDPESLTPGGFQRGLGALDHRVEGTELDDMESLGPSLQTRSIPGRLNDGGCVNTKSVCK